MLRYCYPVRRLLSILLLLPILAFAAPTVPWACRAHRSLPETNQLKARAPIVLRTPSAQAFQKSNINPRKLSHNLWAN